MRHPIDPKIDCVFKAQLLPHADLPARILYTWADLYSQQLQSGQDDGNSAPPMPMS